MNTGALEQDDLVRASIQLSVIYRRLGDLVRSRVYAEQAIAQASSEESGKLYADARFARARLATYEGHFDNAIESYKVAYGAYRKLHLHAECSRIMSNLADVYIRAGRLGAAERATASAERTAQRYSIDGLQSRVGVLRGILEAARGNSRKAVALWLEALEIAKRTRDREMTFSAEFQLFKNALQSGHSAAAAAFGRRLNRLWPWVASDDPDIAEFRRLWEANRPSRRRPVAAPQHANDERGNPPSADRL